MITKDLSFAQLGLGDFPKPMHWSLVALEPIELPFMLSVFNFFRLGIIRTVHLNVRITVRVRSFLGILCGVR